MKVRTCSERYYYPIMLTAFFDKQKYKVGSPALIMIS